jgi:hypothetical protein
MKNIVALGFFVLASIGNAATWQDIVTPSAAQLEMACKAGAEIGVMPRVTTAQTASANAAERTATAGLLVSDSRNFGTGLLSVVNSYLERIELTLPAGVAYALCRKRALDLQTPVSVASLPPTLDVSVRGSVDSLRTAAGWAAVVVLLDANGDELARRSPLSSTTADPGLWRVSCSKSCTWYGQNLYRYDLANAPEGLAKLRLLISRGRGVETRDYTLADLSSPSLRTP